MFPIYIYIVYIYIYVDLLAVLTFEHSCVLYIYTYIYIYIYIYMLPPLGPTFPLQNVQNPLISKDRGCEHIYARGVLLLHIFLWVTKSC